MIAPGLLVKTDTRIDIKMLVHEFQAKRIDHIDRARKPAMHTEAERLRRLGAAGQIDHLELKARGDIMPQRAAAPGLAGKGFSWP